LFVAPSKNSGRLLLSRTGFFRVTPPTGPHRPARGAKKPDTQIKGSSFAVELVALPVDKVVWG